MRRSCSQSTAVASARQGNPKAGLGRPEATQAALIPITKSPAWWDLAPEALDTLYAEQAFARELERAMDPKGESGTMKAVMARIGAS